MGVIHEEEEKNANKSRDTATLKFKLFLPFRPKWAHYTAVSRGDCVYGYDKQSCNVHVADKR